jgi:hypothetical protein
MNTIEDDANEIAEFYLQNPAIKPMTEERVQFVNSIKEEQKQTIADALEKAEEDLKNVDLNEPLPYGKQLSFQQPVREDVKAEDFKVSRKFIMKRIVIDKFTTKAIRVPLTPSTCDTCGFDVAEKNFGEWDHSPLDQRSILITALQAHKKMYHSVSDQLIIDESQLPTRWLGNKGSMK